MDAARSEEATQSDHQQECILSGGVYLRHRLRKANFQKNLPCCFPPRNTLSQERSACKIGVRACWRARSWKSFKQVALLDFSL